MIARILIVSENPRTMQMLNYTLSQAGYHACLASDAESACRLAVQFQPNIALIDGFRSAMNGEQIVRDINQIPYSPIIIATSGNQAETEQRLLQSGCSAIVNHPLNMRHLLDVINSALEK